MSREQKLALTLLALAGVAAALGYWSQNGGNGGLLGRFGIERPKK